MPSRPVIAICAAIERVSWGAWREVEVVMAPRNYVRAVNAAGGRAIVVSPEETVGGRPDEIIDGLDGLILAGGSDLDPGSYGGTPHPETAGSRPERDHFEVELTRRALALELPVLGVCRGMQLLNVARGGTVAQHLPETLGHERHREAPGRFSEHEVRLEPGSAAAAAVGATAATVQSHHHQGIDRLGSGTLASGWDLEDGTIEAIELTDSRSYALGVLWHPEEDPRSRVIASLLEAAARVPA